MPVAFSSWHFLFMKCWIVIYDNDNKRWITQPGEIIDDGFIFSRVKFVTTAGIEAVGVFSKKHISLCQE